MTYIHLYFSLVLQCIILNSYLSAFTQTVFFQINIATDGATTYVSFVYQDGEMLWKTSPRRPRVGYSIQATNGRKEKFELVLNGNGSFSAYKFDEVIGNTGAKGRWSWKLSGNFSGNVNDSGMNSFITATPALLEFSLLFYNLSG